MEPLTPSSTPVGTSPLGPGAEAGGGERGELDRLGI